MYNPIESSMYIKVRYHIIRNREDSRNEGLEMILEVESWLNDALLSLPAYEYDDRRNHRSEEHETAEYSQSDHGP